MYVFVNFFTGTAGDSLSKSSGEKFSTRDVDNDLQLKNSCAIKRHGAWWFGNCGHAHLNGEYLAGALKEEKRAQGVFWRGFKGYHYSYKTAEMKVGPADN